MKKTVFALLLMIACSVVVNAQFNADKEPLIVKSLSNESFKKVVPVLIVCVWLGKVKFGEVVVPG